MAVVTPVQGSTTAASMDSGPNTLLRQLMSNVSACSHDARTHATSAGDSINTTFNGNQYQIRCINNIVYQYA